MKKNILLVCAFAIVALAAFNLNLTLDKDSRVNVILSNKLAIAENELGGPGGCYTTVCTCYPSDYIVRDIYSCVMPGPDKSCESGVIEWEYDYLIKDTVKEFRCPSGN